jgi:hypothetical protein
MPHLLKKMMNQQMGLDSIQITHLDWLAFALEQKALSDY